jgi:Co/Zn/Cd efflux system component
MSAGCCPTPKAPAVDPRFRKALWIALFVNAAMFLVEVASGFNAESVSLLADAADFLGDSANYALSLFVLALAPVWRSRAALLKGFSMGAYGIAVLGLTAYNFYRGASPDAATMGAIGFLALAANVGVAVMLYRFRGGDSNMRSVWLCSRNDAIGNVAILLAALGVFGTGSAWPDLAVACIMAALGITASVSVVRQSLAEMREARPAGHRHPA